MPKDYAKSTAQASHPGRLRYWFVMFLSSIIIAIGAYLMIKNNIWQIKPLWQSKHTVKTVLAKTNTKNPDPDIHFDFYSELPSMQVTQPKMVEKNNDLPPTPIAIATKPCVTSTLLASEVQKKLKPCITNDLSGQYVVQIAAFKNEIAASEYRISLLLGGFDANIVKTDNEPSIYRIQQGPYPSIRLAKINQQRLLRKGIKSVVIKL